MEEQAFSSRPEGQLIVLGDRPRRERFGRWFVVHAKLGQLEELAAETGPCVVVISAPELQRLDPGHVRCQTVEAGLGLALLVEAADVAALAGWIAAGVETWCSRAALAAVVAAELRRIAPPRGGGRSGPPAWTQDQMVRELRAWLVAAETTPTVAELAAGLATSERSLRRHLRRAGAPSPLELIQLGLLDAVGRDRLAGLPSLLSAHRLGYANVSGLNRALARAEAIRRRFRET